MPIRETASTLGKAITMPTARQSIPPFREDRPLAGRVRKYCADEWNRTREYWRSIFGGRSAGWWFGGVIGFVLFVLITALLKVDLRNFALVPILAGGAAGNWIWTRVRENPSSRNALCLGLVALGTVLFVTNILPEYRENLFGSGGGYVWSTESSFLAGIGAALVLLGAVNRKATNYN